MWSALLDKSIVFNFDSTGFARHQKSYFEDDIEFSAEQRFLITGGTSGLGKTLCELLDEAQAHTVITGRHKEKAEPILAACSRAKFIEFDLADWSAIDNALDAINEASQSLPVFDGVVLNAGGMPEKFSANSQGIELQAASQLFGHYYLLKRLQKRNQLKVGARIVWMTSGGMYLKSFDAKTFFEGYDYNKVSAYANTKRAQVEVLPLIAEEFSQQIVAATHPGWVDTPGLRESLPGFTQRFANRLRTAKEGVDTAYWLLGSKKEPESGKLYFDRKPVSKNLQFLKKSNAGDGPKVFDLLQKYLPE